MQLADLTNQWFEFVFGRAYYDKNVHKIIEIDDWHE